jgi:uronate dehydrogenase
MKKIVLTGAAGRLGNELRSQLANMADTLLSTDIADSIDNLAANETYVQADLADYDAIFPLIEGADMVVHFGAIVDERPFPELLGPNFVGSYNIWEAAHQHGARRVVYASSIHAVGMHPKIDNIGIDAAHRPDTFYGLAKCFTEDLGRMYWEKHGLESVHLRILSCTEAPNNARALGSWLSYADAIQLVTRAVDTPVVEFSVIYGVSNNDRAPVDNTAANHLGFRPKDNAEDFADAVLAKEPVANLDDLSATRHGGPFASTPLGKSGLGGFGMKAKK